MIIKIYELFRLGLILVSVFIFTSCVTIRELEFKGIENVMVKEFSQNGIDADILATIYNPNSFNIKIVNSDLDFYVGGVKMGKANMEKKIKIKKNLEKTYVISLKAGAKQMNLGLSAMMNMLLAQTANIQVKGTIKARSMMVTKKVPFSFEQRVKIGN